MIRSQHPPLPTEQSVNNSFAKDEVDKKFQIDLHFREKNQTRDKTKKQKTLNEKVNTS